ncbi:uncharacterized protein VP01_13500g1 [Puccinia sorghi]|uniref:DUF4939 domain-containing protein n=1 Tax=Puccinia sorghi TaxID=27349 RepID=A0A0L6VNW1_9BASI|nr:uncharacterized protein VP01_13500g1 [Puccinia sorghi]
MTKKSAQLLATEETLQRTQARLDAQQHPAPAPAPNPIKLAKPQPFDGTRGTAEEVFVAQIALHAITYPECFPTNTSKVAFVTLFMQDYTATWCQPYLNRIFNGEPQIGPTSSKTWRPGSLTTTANNKPRWPCRTSAKPGLRQTIRRTSTSTPALPGGPTPCS